MDVHPSESIFRELRQVLDTGCYDGQVSPEDHWHQVQPYILFLRSSRLRDGKSEANRGANVLVGTFVL